MFIYWNDISEAEIMRQKFKFHVIDGRKGFWLRGRDRMISGIETTGDWTCFSKKFFEADQIEYFFEKEEDAIMFKLSF
jgi:hypothetical protein